MDRAVKESKKAFTSWKKVCFSEFIYGNQKNNANNEWGYFIYKRPVNYTTFTTSDTIQAAGFSILKNDPAVYSYTGNPSMQAYIGFPVTGTNSNNYFLAYL